GPLRASEVHRNQQGARRDRAQAFDARLPGPCATSALVSGAAPTARKVGRQRYPGCPDGRLASPAGLGCALKGEWEAGSRTPLCDRSRKEERHQGHGLENGSEPQGSKSPSCEWRSFSRSVAKPVKRNRTQGKPRG